mgnify:CR=1 FL=1
MKRCLFMINSILLTAILIIIFNVSADSITIKDRYRERREEKRQSDRNSKEKTDADSIKELEKNIKNRRKAGEIIPWTVLNSVEVIYENQLSFEEAKNRKSSPAPHPERIVLSANVTNQTSYPITALLLYVKILDDAGALIFEKEVVAWKELPAWKTMRIRPVCVESISQETAQIVNKIRELLRNSSVKVEAQVGKILWKNGKVTANLP